MKVNKWFGLVCIAAIMSSCAVSSDEKKENNGYENDVIKTIMERRSIRKYQDKPVSRDILQTLVECGVNAPNAVNRQQWQVRVVDNASYIDGISAVYKAANPKVEQDADFKNMFRNAPAVIFIASPKNGAEQVDCGLMGENIILAAQSLGLGTCCLGGPVAFMKQNPEAAEYVEKLQLPDDYELLYAIGVGYPDESPTAKPRDMGKVKFID